jgi:hypothetical protein
MVVGATRALRAMQRKRFRREYSTTSFTRVITFTPPPRQKCPLVCRFHHYSQDLVDNQVSKNIELENVVTLIVHLHKPFHDYLFKPTLYLLLFSMCDYP